MWRYAVSVYAEKKKMISNMKQNVRGIFYNHG